MKKLLAALVTIGAIAGGTTAALGQVSCAEWNTLKFFRMATAADVIQCLEAGANLEARDRDRATPCTRRRSTLRR